VLWRENRNFAITVQSDIRDGIQPATVSDQIWNSPGMAAVRDGLPAGYRLVIAGAAEESDKAARRSRQGAAGAVHHLHAADAAAEELLALDAGVPHRALGFIGAAAALLALQRPFGFVASWA